MTLFKGQKAVLKHFLEIKKGLHSQIAYNLYGKQICAAELVLVQRHETRSMHFVHYVVPRASNFKAEREITFSCCRDIQERFWQNFSELHICNINDSSILGA